MSSIFFRPRSGTKKERGKTMEWQEFKILETMNIKVLVIDGRRILNPDKFENYIGIGRYYE
ncbi:MAG: hypothetical protein ACP5IC_02790 [Minisyncoccia bacterium]